MPKIRYLQGFPRFYCQQASIFFNLYQLPFSIQMSICPVQAEGLLLPHCLFFASQLNDGNNLNGLMRLTSTPG